MSSVRYASPEYSTALAVIGMAGRFPGASSLEQFWQNIAGKVGSIRHYSAEELWAAGVRAEDLSQPNYVRAGTVLENVENFDTSFFGFHPREAELMDPQFRIFLECVWEVLEMAGYDLTTCGGLIGVFAGAGYKNYLRHHVQKARRIEASEFQQSLGHEADVLASMISYKLNLKGPSVSVQSFCSTSLVAVHLACQSLLNYECDMAVAGGVALNSLQMKGYFYEEGEIASPDGSCRPFDARSQGTVLSNGAAVVVLKRLQEALDDGDHIYSVIRGSAMNNDGNQRVSYTAPGLDGQASVIASALSYTRVHPETIAYIEANGSGTQMGDAIELAALTKAFSAKTQKKQFCAVGSLKSNVGHLDRASGVAGLIKTTLALGHRQLPPQLEYEQPNPEIDLQQSPFYVNTSLKPWPQAQVPRRAGLNSFGLGGTNVHLVLEEAPEQLSSSPSRPWQVLPLSARSAWSLKQMSSNLIAHLKAHPEQSMADIAYTLQVGRCAFNYRQFVVARTAEEACAVLEQQALPIHQEHRDRPLAFLFPGAAERPLNIARQLYAQEPHFREVVLTCCQNLRERLHMDLQALFLPAQEASDTPDRSGHEPLMFIVEYALAQLLMEWKLRPQAMLGYGTGECVAACLAGVISLEDALTLVAHRTQLMTSHSEDVPRSPEALLRTVRLQKPRIPYISSVTGTWITEEQATDPDYWMQQMCEPVQFARGIEALLQGSAPVLLEVGAEEMLSSMYTQVISFGTHDSGQAALLTAIGRVWLAGVTIDWKSLHAQERRLRVALPTYPFERQHCWIDDPDRRNSSHLRALAMKKEPDVADWFYLPSWQRSFPPASSLPAPQKPAENLCIVFTDPCGIGAQIAQHLEQAGYSIIWVETGDAFAQQDQNHFSVRADRDADYAALFKELNRCELLPRTLIHCWSVTEEAEISSHASSFAAQQKRGFFSLLCLARAISALMYDTLIHLTVFSNHIQAVTGQELLQPEKAPIIAACKVIAQEYSYIACQHIDLLLAPGATGGRHESVIDRADRGRAGLDGTGWASESFVEDLARECLTEPTDMLVAYRGSTRWVERHTAVRLAQVERASSLFQTGGVYLLVGGSGEIGLTLAEYLATAVQARLVFIDEAPFPARDQWADRLRDQQQDDVVSETMRRLQALQARGIHIDMRQANLADEADMKQTIDEVLAQCAVIHGILYLPAGTETQTIQDIDQAGCEAYFRLNMQCLCALEQALQGLSLDFCLLFSSLSGVLGGLGYAAEAAASVFMDAFVFKQNQTSATRWINVAWDLWQTKEHEQSVPGTTSVRPLISSQEGVDAFSRIIASRWTNIITSTGDLHARVQQWVLAKKEQITHCEPAPLNPDSRRPNIATAYAPPTNHTEQKIVEIWQRLLGFDQIGIHDNFFELHGHSLAGMQLIARLRQIFQVNVPLAKLFEGPTVAELATVIEALIIEEIEKLDEEEVRLLL